MTSEVAFAEIQQNFGVDSDGRRVPFELSFVMAKDISTKYRLVFLMESSEHLKNRRDFVFTRGLQVK
ncbi:hypothetical protein GN244_ATG02665 [Phytophthora infestans]|uniref:Uncharacterized protein n=1 Tax=Phytophthora infestans TaxID=4787 RepID=A0A833WP71_PHYIN|nr:hypothetical protein GN244_ATG02665 [Phytophthora infestans]KAF4138905.1 hypothetical protein GN958_ATG11862 [Phytophthora infestans]